MIKVLCILARIRIFVIGLNYYRYLQSIANISLLISRLLCSDKSIDWPCVEALPCI